MSRENCTAPLAAGGIFVLSTAAKAQNPPENTRSAIQEKRAPVRRHFGWEFLTLVRGKSMGIT
jgi:hypothetical protein